MQSALIQIYCQLLSMQSQSVEYKTNRLTLCNKIRQILSDIFSTKKKTKELILKTECFRSFGWLVYGRTFHRISLIATLVRRFDSTVE